MNDIGKDIPALDRGRGTGEVAIIGMAGIFPQAPDLRTFWQNIVSKVDAIDDPPADSMVSQVYDPSATASNRIYCKRGGYLKELPPFQPADFGIMPVALDGAEPEHFMALQVAYDALVDAGFPHKPFNRAKTQVIIGRGTFVNRAYITVLQHVLVIDQTIDLLKELHPEHTDVELAALKEKLHASLPPFNADTAPGLPHSVMAGIIANRLDLKGPCMVIDAACASSLLALEIAMRDLLSGKCDVALIGGVQISTGAPIHMLFTQLGALSHLPHLCPFDKGADGTMLGEGIGMMVLKRREDAVRDGHRIYALVNGVGSSSDGKGKGLLAPQVEGEELALRRAYEITGIDPQSIGLIEAHGTAIPLGDVTEVQALRRVFGDRTDGPARVALGTVKSMIGHLIPAAGIAGLIKTALALYHKILPPTLHLEEPNPHLEIDKTPFYFNTETRAWIHGNSKSPRRAGVNAFGFGGINTHAILEEYIDTASSQPHYNRYWENELVVIEGGSRLGLISQCEATKKFVARQADKDWVDIAYTLVRRVAEKPCRLALVANSPADLIKKLEHAVKKLEDPQRVQIKDRSGIYFFEQPLGRQGKLAFLFPGEGSQYPHMLQDLCQHFPEVRACFDLLDQAFVGHPRGYLPSQIIYPPTERQAGEADGGIWQLDDAVDAVITADRALFRLLTLMGITPDAIVGHSSGELMALEAAGAIALAGDGDLVHFIQAGNRMIEKLQSAREIPEAVLLAVGGVDGQFIEKIIDRSQDFLRLAMDNCPHQVVLCGTEQAVTAAAGTCRDQGGICQVLPFRRAYHTERFRPVLGPLQEFFQKATIVPPAIPLYSCMTAGLFPKVPEDILRYAVEQWARPVRFRQTIETMYAEGVRIFLEVGPRSNLTGFVNDILKGQPFLSVSCDAHRRPTITQLQHALAMLAAHGVSLNLEILYRHRAPRYLDATEGGAKTPAPGIRISLELPVLSLKKADLPNFQSRSEGLAEDSRETVPAADKGILDQQPTATDQPEMPTQQILPSIGQNQGRRAQPAEISSLSDVGQTDEIQAVMQENMRTMARFLEVQEEVMRVYLQGASRLTQALESPGQQEIGHPDHEGFPSLGAAAAEDSGPLPGKASPLPEESAATSTVVGASLKRDTLSTLLLTLISEKTGYPLDILNDKQNLEADLGIDSIKRLEILGAMIQHLGLAPESTENFVTLRTVSEIVEFIINSAVASESSSLEGEQNPSPSTPKEGDRPAAGPELPAALKPGGVIRHLVPAREVSVLRVLDLAADGWLKDHTLGGQVSQNNPDLLGLAVVPLSISLEMMAATASLLTPGQHLVGLKNIAVQDWLALPAGVLEVRITARSASESTQEIEVLLEVLDRSPNAPERSRTALTGNMIFALEYPAAGRLDDFHPGPALVSLPSKEDFYPQALFHGPAFRCVHAIRQAGELGMEVELAAPPEKPFFSEAGNSSLLTDPVLLDGAGQVVGLWATAALKENFVIFPRGIDKITLFAPLQQIRGPVICKAIPRLAGLTQIRSDIHLLTADGELLATLEGLVHNRAQLPPLLHHFRGSRKILLSRPWPLLIYSPGGSVKSVCRRLDPLAVDFGAPDGEIWLTMLAHIILSQPERRKWLQLQGPAKRRQEWLMARLAGKEAVRCLLQEHYGLECWPADIEIYPDSYGKPLVRGDWLEHLKAAPELSLAHSAGVAVALVADGASEARVGIDLEAVRRPGKGLLPLTFDPEEEELLADMAAAEIDEWHLRFWCAKEAVAKALGTGLPNGPREVKVMAILTANGKVSLTLLGKLAQDFRPFTGTPLVVQTDREGEFVVATACFPNNVKNSETVRGPLSQQEFCKARPDMIP